MGAQTAQQLADAYGYEIWSPTFLRTHGFTSAFTAAELTQIGDSPVPTQVGISLIETATNEDARALNQQLIRETHQQRIWAKATPGDIWVNVSPRIPGAIGGGDKSATTNFAALGVSFVVGNIVVAINEQGSLTVKQVDQIAEAQYRQLIGSST